MNKLSKILLVIIVFLTIALGVMIYYYFYWRNGALFTSNEMLKMTKAMEKEGYGIKIEDEGETYVMVRLDEYEEQEPE